MDHFLKFVTPVKEVGRYDDRMKFHHAAPASGITILRNFANLLITKTYHSRPITHISSSFPSPLSSSITPLFHSSLRTDVFHKSFLP